MNVFEELRLSEKRDRFGEILLRGPSAVYEAFLEVCDDEGREGIREILYIADYDATDAITSDSQQRETGRLSCDI